MKTHFLSRLSIALGLAILSTTYVQAEISIEHRLNVPGMVEVAVDPKPSLNAQVNQDTIRRGQSTVLSWSGHRIKHVVIDGVYQVSANSGTQVLTPLSTHTYELSTSNLHGDAHSQATVRVLDPEATITGLASPISILAGQTSTLSWIATHASGVSIDGLGTFGVESSVEVTPSSTTVYPLIAHGDEMQVQHDVTVTVVPRDDRSCHALLSQDSTLESGVYLIQGHETFCHMSVNGGGYTLVGAISNDEQSTWTYNNYPSLNAGQSVGSVHNLARDFNSPLMAALAGSDLILTSLSATGQSNPAFLNYNNVLRGRSLGQAVSQASHTDQEYTPSARSGTWTGDSACDASDVMYMRVNPRDDDSATDNIYTSYARGFGFRSKSNNNCYYDDVVNAWTASYTVNTSIRDVEYWRAQNVNNFPGAMLMWVR
ncbi:hypothetical protein AB6D11_00560 [Vibrio splendidus]